MKKIVLIAITLAILSSCAPFLVTTGPTKKPGWEQREYNHQRERDNRAERGRGWKYGHEKKIEKGSYLMFVKENPKFKNITVVINDRIRIDIGNDYKYNKGAKTKQVKVKPGRYFIKVYANGKFLYDRWIYVGDDNNVRVVL